MTEEYGTKRKTAAEKYGAQQAGGTGSTGQSKLFGATQETIDKATEAKLAAADEAAKIPGVIKEAGGTQAAAATGAGERLAGAYGTAATGYGSAYNKAREGLGAAYGTASGAIEAKHRNALVAARQALGDAAMRSMQRGRTTAGNIGAAGTLGKQAAATYGQMASQQAFEQGQLGIMSAQEQAQLGLGEAGVMEKMGLGEAGALSEAQLMAAGFTAEAAKEAAGATLAAADIYHQAILSQAEAEGTKFFMNAEQAADAQANLDYQLAQIATAGEGNAQDGVNQAMAYMGDWPAEMDPQQKVEFIQLLNQAMINVPGFGPGTGLWTPNQAYAMAAKFGPANALQMMSQVGDWMQKFAGPNGELIEMLPSNVGLVLDRIMEVGSFHTGYAYLMPGTNAIQFADDAGGVPEGGTVLTQELAYGSKPAE